MNEDNEGTQGPLEIRHNVMKAGGLCKMVQVCMVVMQKFGVNAMCPGYNARKYERRKRAKPTVESEGYYTPPSVESDFAHYKQD